MQKQKKAKEQKKNKRSLVVFPVLFCTFPNVDIFAEFLASDEELNKVTQALDEAVAQLLPHPLIKFLYNRATHRPPSHTYFTILKVNQIVIMTWTQIFPGEMSKTFHHSS